MLCIKYVSDLFVKKKEWKGRNVYMLKEQIKYTDYNGNERTEDFYFNLNEAEVMEMELSAEGGLKNMMDRIIEAQDGASIIKVFKELILKAYGKKSPDGRCFVKSEELSASFSQTEAYSKLFVKLVTDAEAAANFVNGVVAGNEPAKPITEV